jgi:hypothetical protein
MSTGLSIQERYIQNFPQQAPVKIAASFLVTTAINLFSNTLQGALFVGGMAATATLIEAITRPIIREIFPQDESPQIIPKAAQIIIPEIIALGLGASIAPYLGVSYKVNMFKDNALQKWFSIFSWCVLNFTAWNRNAPYAAVL